MPLRYIALAGSAALMTACSTFENDSGESPVTTNPAFEPRIIWDPAPAEGPGADWRNIGRMELAQRINQVEYDGQAKNVILFIADGLSLTTITATRIYDGQSRGMSGEENYLSFERWGHSALVKTYSENAQVPDSAATATALHTGVKTHSGAISVYARDYLEACGEDAVVPATLMELAEARGLSTGIVSTARLTHATPATAYAHSPDRGWESDVTLPDDARAAGCRDIAEQLIDFRFDHGDGFEVALGGGAAAFRSTERGGMRQDGRDIAEEWSILGGTFVTTRDELRAASGTQAQVLGLFSQSHMPFALDYDEDTTAPTLTEMTEFAINRLDDDEEGFVLMVEAGRVDHAHHGSNAARALADAQEFARAVEQAASMTDPSETLIIVTADHGHVFTIAGYPRRGNPILGLARPAAPNLSDAMTPPDPAMDGRPYTTLGYHNGQNQRSSDEPPLTDEQVMDPDYQQESAIPMGSETHSGEDVIAFARGPKAHLVDGVMEQHTLFYIMAHALGWE